MNKRYELAPTDGRKSFYGKAIVVVMCDGSEVLYSYGTIIARKMKSGEIVRLWGGWSQTTGRHIKAFCGLCKSEWERLPYEGDHTSGGRVLSNQESYNAMIARRAAK